jgi:hypothetical protein
VENPAAKVLVDIARIQDDTVGDGTTRYGDLQILVHLNVPALTNPFILQCDCPVR